MLLLAAQMLQDARERAGEAAWRAALARESSARAHDRVADLHDRLAEAGNGDAAGHRLQAGWRRRAAETDRTVPAQPAPAQP